MNDDARHQRAFSHRDRPLADSSRETQQALRDARGGRHRYLDIRRREASRCPPIRDVAYAHVAYAHVAYARPPRAIVRIDVTGITLLRAPQKNL
ncbi:hypothetical protein AQ610_10240 [Burkholderia humptydooensis]|uniref:Uncharacterized protein n=1 Tax=Burkholderia humptydooensis MSMB43 TaxID=441157 RepID=A0ABN0G640_9BURK|nr:hypothetical protein [Burkholderia humptydooensis]ALX42755.1 hypothetical protein AQ610_10240 [Burkholderia humptydooensis]EIP87671.1 hypothetical protein A33K_15692 [Burkholderia humptydooensis MSMB43]